MCDVQLLEKITLYCFKTTMDVAIDLEHVCSKYNWLTAGRCGHRLPSSIAYKAYVCRI